MTLSRTLSLCAGAARLDLGVQSVAEVELVSYAETDPAASAVMRHHFPAIPNPGDIRTVDWNEVVGVDFITAGYPCQPFSINGQRRGSEDDRHGRKVW